ncbi:MAG: glycosyltransferase N-terminal domain-containing protein [Bacteroidales bacterium]|nr:glycosyltransferase N-terminal domain-containing protein [Bacteroidales bacterium]MEE1221288.1 glycosyltransferase N-terminal domain-containing protein [Bacteroidales bacterium]
MLKGEKECFDRLQNLNSEDKVAWFHCASLGEFEQGRPLIEEVKKQFPEYKILLSFYSPSGYESKKDYALADYVVYLPNDTKSNAKKFVKKVNPDLIFFIKYEFWYNYISALKGRRLFQVSLILRQNQYFFSWYGKWFAKQLKNFEHFFVQNQQTANLLNKIGYKNVTISGDTRFDRVMTIANNAKSFTEIEKFCEGNQKIILAGSSWLADEKIIQQAVKNLDIKLIIAPHVVGENHINEIQQLFPEAILYSELANNDKKSNILIINCIGILSNLYQYCDIAYIGGGFGVGIHNTLEAATFGKPICFGTNYHKFQEAIDLINLKAAYSISNQEELKQVLETLLNNEKIYNQSAEASKDYVKTKIGACKKIIEHLKN